jgi:hypothetical protein
MLPRECLISPTGFAGLIAMLGFVFFSRWTEYVYNGLAGFYNFAGDLHTLLDNHGYAESFYDQGHAQGFQNHRSNYALATLEASRYDFDDAHYSYELANGKDRHLILLLTPETFIYGKIKMQKRYPGISML